MYLNPDNLSQATNFVNSPLWQDFKRNLLLRRPPEPEAADAVHTQAAKGFARVGYEAAIDNLEKLAREITPAAPTDPFDRPALTEIRD